MKVFGIVGWKNTGKTGLMERLVQHFTGQGLTVSTIKHTHHLVDLDQPGTDSYRHRSAGAQEVLLASSARYAVMHELREAPEPSLDDLLDRLRPVDLVLVEGYKTAPHAKIETHRKAVAQPLLATSNSSIRAVASDCPLDIALPVLDLDYTARIAEFILRDSAL